MSVNQMMSQMPAGYRFGGANIALPRHTTTLRWLAVKQPYEALSKTHLLTFERLQRATELDAKELQSIQNFDHAYR